MNRTSVGDVVRLLPDRLRSYDAWYFAPGGVPEGLREYRRELAAHLAGVLGFDPPEGFVAQVQQAAAGPVSEWYRVMLGREDASRSVS